MMKKLILIFSLFCSAFFFSQIKKSDLLGTWRVKNVSYNYKMSSPSEKMRIEAIKKLFLQASFVFRNNNTADFNISSSEIAVKNGTYKIEMENVVSIHKGKDKMMKFFVENKKEKTYFVIADAQIPYLILEVEK